MSPEDLELFRNKTAELLSSENPASKLFGSILNDAIDHIDSQAAQIDALKEKLVSERSQTLYWDNHAVSEYWAAKKIAYQHKARKQLAEEMKEVDWE